MLPLVDEECRTPKGADTALAQKISKQLQSLGHEQGHAAVVDVLITAVLSTAGVTATTPAVMVSTIFGDEQHVLAAIEAGAMGYLLKDLAADAVLEEVRSLHAGGREGGKVDEGQTDSRLRE